MVYIKSLSGLQPWADGASLGGKKRMIWVRRFFAVLLILLFLPLFFAALFLLHVNATVLSADFYVKELRKAALPVFLYDQLLPTAFDEFAAESWKLSVDPTKVRTKAIGAFREVFPPQWLQDRMESVVIEVVPYVTGETEGFSIAVPVRDRLVALGGALQGPGLLRRFAKERPAEPAGG
ncbi:MAG: hypothetical protein EXR55_04390 [Dehalococcoidia bacterium]|nr:hypothetical protein [Dehalococcoidia bacterium]